VPRLQNHSANPEGARRDKPYAWFAWRYNQRVRGKLQRERWKIFALIFEDGFGNRPDEEEDRFAAAAAGELAAGMAADSCRHSSTSHIKPFNEELRDRQHPTLDIFLNRVAGKTSGTLHGFFYHAAEGHCS